MVLCCKKTQIIVISNDTYCHNHTGCEEQRINLHKHSMNLPSVLLTKYNLQASDTFLHKRQFKNCKHIKYVSTKTEERAGAYFRTYILRVDSVFRLCYVLFSLTQSYVCFIFA